MSWDEKRSWAFVGSLLLGAASYIAVVGVRAQSVPLVEVAYVGPLLVMIVGVIALTVVGAVLSSMRDPDEDRISDERDLQIDQKAQKVGYLVLSLAFLGVWAAVWYEAPHFWLAQGILGAFLAASLIESAVKLNTYKNGA